MAARLGYLLVSLLLVGYFALVGQRAVALIQHGTWISVSLGAAACTLPPIGAWFLWHSTRFAVRANRLTRELDAEGGLPVDDLPRAPSGRVEREAADRVFAERRAETEASPQDWRCWFRLALAYHDARDVSRARKAMKHAIDLHAQDPSPAGGDPSAGEHGTAAQGPAPVPGPEGELPAPARPSGRTESGAASDA